MTADNRPSWDVYFLNIARAVAERSTCVRRKVGAVVVRDKHILSTGYNGVPKGAPHRDETTCVRIGLKSGERADLVCCAHAEGNAIAQAAHHGVRVEGATLYCTTAPCAWCARTIINAGVVRVVYDEGYADENAAQVYRESSVVVDRVELPKAETGDDVARLVRCMSGPPGASLEWLSASIQKHAPWNGAQHCDSTRTEMCQLLSRLGGDGAAEGLRKTSVAGVEDEIAKLVEHLEERAQYKLRKELREVAVALGYAEGATMEVMVLAIHHLKREAARAFPPPEPTLMEHAQLKAKLDAVDKETRAIIEEDIRYTYGPHVNGNALGALRAAKRVRQAAGFGGLVVEPGPFAKLTDS